MSEKELTDITLTDLWKEFNSIGGFLGETGGDNKGIQEDIYRKST